MDIDAFENQNDDSTDEIVPNKPPTERPIDFTYISSEEDDINSNAGEEVGEFEDSDSIMLGDEDENETDAECSQNDVSNYIANEVLLSQHAVPAGIGFGSAGKSQKSTTSESNPEAIRAKIRAIASDKSLSEQERSEACQNIYANNYVVQKKAEAKLFAEKCRKRKHRQSISKHRDNNGKRLLGCDHYPRNCKIRADCCGMWVVCRHCHDVTCVTNDHRIDRFKTKRIICMFCNTEQSVRSKCLNTSCGVKFAKYFCKYCKFWDNTPNKDIYHCDKCRLCRVGKGLGRDNYHCDKCNVCVSLDPDGVDDHTCLKETLDSDCPVCSEHMLTSTEQVVFMQCGHAMHLKCFNEYTEDNYVCPLCSKAVTDMSPYYGLIDQAVENQPMPPEYSKKKAEILCHECEITCITKFHFIYLKCISCNGYNTRLIRKRDEDEDIRILEKPGSSDKSKG